MGLDIRLPLGAFFAVIGAVLGTYGLFSNPAIYKQSLGININLEWGVVLVVFGLLMIFASVRKPARK